MTFVRFGDEFDQLQENTLFYGLWSGFRAKFSSQAERNLKTPFLAYCCFRIGWN